MVAERYRQKPEGEEESPDQAAGQSWPDMS
jgi:hypothetical protein